MIEQRTEAWQNQRIGNLTASRMCAACDVLKNGKSSSKREQLIWDIVTERLTGVPTSVFRTSAMQWGIDYEDEGKLFFETHTGILIQDCGFFKHPSIKDYGASPDGLIGADTVFELKCPNSSTHLKTVIEGVVPDQYRPQILSQLSCTGRKKAIFASYDPRILDEGLQLFWIEWNPDPSEIEKIELVALQLLSEVDQVMETLLNKAA